MYKWMNRARFLAPGAALLGLLQAANMIDFNQILFQFLAQFLSLFVAVLFGNTSSLPMA